MSDTTFIPGTTIESPWLNDVNDTVYDVLGDGTLAPTSAAEARTNLDVPQTDGTGATGNWPVNAVNVTGTVAIANGGTGQTTAPAAFTALKQAATNTDTGVVELATSAEVATGTDTTRAITPAALRSGTINSVVQVRTANGYGSTNTVVRRWTTTVQAVGTDITYADSATLGGSFTINSNGIYAISYSDQFNAASSVAITNTNTSLNGLPSASDILAVQTTNAANVAGNASWTGYLTSGTIVRARTYIANASGTLTTAEQFTITRIA